LREKYERGNKNRRQILMKREEKGKLKWKLRVKVKKAK
jgi:hypothetical protein